MKTFLAFVLAGILILMAGCTAVDPYTEDAYYYDLYTHNIEIGDVTTAYTLTINGVAVGGGGLEIDPIFTASPAFGITALNIAAWNASVGDMTKAVYDPANIAQQLVGISAAQSLTNKQLTMNNADSIKWKTAGGVPQNTITLLASNVLQITNVSGAVQLLGGSINLNSGIDEEIYLWGNNVGTGRELVLYGSSSSVVNTLRDSPTINMGAYYWDGGAGVGWSGTILHDMITAGATPKSQLKFAINSASILRLENNNGTVKIIADGVLDMNDNYVNNIKRLNLTDPTELTIAAGAITVTQGYHTVDTESDDATDDLDTINGGNLGDRITLAGANDARMIRITRAGNIRFQAEHMLEVFTFASPAGSSGTFYTGGYYDCPAADANLTQASTTVAYGTLKSPYGARAILVAKQAGTTNAGTVSIVVSGISVTDAGVRNPADSETLVADITAMTPNKFYQTTKKWVGAVTYTLTPVGAATYAADFNYGLAAYDSFDKRNFYITLVEVMGRAGANDTGFDIQLLHHKATGWTYSAAAFVAGTGVAASLVTDYSTDNDLVTNERFKWEHELNLAVSGATWSEGFLFKVVTTANKAVEFMNISTYAIVVPNDLHLRGTGQSYNFLYNGTYWMEN